MKMSAYHKRPNDGMNAVQRYHKKCESITIRPKLEDGAKIRQTAIDMGYESLTQFIMDSINEFVEKHKPEEDALIISTDEEDYGF